MTTTDETPVAWRYSPDNGAHWHLRHKLEACPSNWIEEPLYTRAHPRGDADTRAPASPEQATEVQSDEQLIAEMLAGLNGVTPGPWVFDGNCGGYITEGGEKIARAYAQRDAWHFARCSPENILRLIALARSAHADIEADGLAKAMEPIADILCDPSEELQDYIECDLERMEWKRKAEALEARLAAVERERDEAEDDGARMLNAEREAHIETSKQAVALALSLQASETTVLALTTAATEARMVLRELNTWAEEHQLIAGLPYPDTYDAVIAQIDAALEQAKP